MSNDKNIYPLDRMQTLLFKHQTHEWILKIQDPDERWLLPFMEDKTSVKEEIFTKRDGVYYLNLTKSRRWTVFKLFLNSLEDLEKAFHRIMSYELMLEEKYYKSTTKKMAIKSDLESRAKAMDWI
ncbi:hypothetical protein FS837_000070 [Tulasnella sp. UAMH 9824]|nr:hypothetical protein FS837_000070 [Tulasnella sp. UAMH 9824]